MSEWVGQLRSRRCCWWSARLRFIYPSSSRTPHTTPSIDLLLQLTHWLQCSRDARSLVVVGGGAYQLVCASKVCVMLCVRGGSCLKASSVDLWQCVMLPQTSYAAQETFQRNCFKLLIRYQTYRCNFWMYFQNSRFKIRTWNMNDLLCRLTQSIWRLCFLLMMTSLKRRTLLSKSLW